MPPVDSYIIQITKGWFRSSLVKSVPPVFSKPIKHFKIEPDEKWVLCGTGKSKLMNILSKKYIAEPPLALQYGNIKKQLPRIEEVQFSGAIPTAHLSARYEFFKDEFDQTCKKFILNDSIGSNNVAYAVSLNDEVVDMDLYNFLIERLKLTELQDRWAMGLSNGQMRRARLARAMLKRPDLLLVDDPFLGLDPTAASLISQFLSTSDKDINVPTVIGLRYQDSIPQWCTHVCFVDEIEGILFSGNISKMKDKVHEIQTQHRKNLDEERRRLSDNNKYTIDDLISSHPMYNKPLHEIIKLPSAIEFKGVNVTYSGEPVLKDLKWDVKPGTKWHIRGDNGTGKSTLLSMIVAEHPQSWNSKVVENGEERRTGNANYFDINKRIGMSSPELHAMFVKSAAQLSVRECIVSGLHEGSSNNFLRMGKSLDTTQQELINMYVTYFGLDDNFETMNFADLTVSQQKLVLFVRSLIKVPEILILDEAFSGMEDTLMLRCHEFLERWPGTVLAVAHVADETPKCDHYIRLMGPGKYEIAAIDN